jgi:hypothetical protein
MDAQRLFKSFLTRNVSAAFYSACFLRDRWNSSTRMSPTPINAQRIAFFGGVYSNYIALEALLDRWDSHGASLASRTVTRQTFC